VRKIIRDTFFDFTAHREGFTPFMYCDTLNLVTTGVGNLIDAGGRNGFDTSDAAMAPAMKLPWKFKGAGWSKTNPVAGDNASQADIKEAWIRTKLQEQNNPGFIKKGGFAYTNLTPLTLDMEGLKSLFSRTLAAFDKSLQSEVRGKNGVLIRGPYVGYESYPADAQLAMLSMSWAMGPAFNFPAFKAAVERRDFDAAAPLSFFKGGGGTQEKPAGRNAENQIMLHNAAMVERLGADPDQLFFPGTSSSVNKGAKPNTGNAPSALASDSTSEIVLGSVVAGVAGYSLFRIGRWKGWF
jgi:hypothetical protein